MTLALILRLIHVLAAFWLVTGLVGRWIVLTAAARSDDLRSVEGLLRAAEVFERRLVIPGSLAVVVAGIATALAMGYPLFGALQGAGSNWILTSLLLVISLFVVIGVVFVPRGRLFAEALEDARSRGAVTPDLKAAFRDRLVLAGHVYELAALLAVIVLMVTRPF